MQNKGLPLEVKVGALVLFSLGLLVAFVFVLGDFSVSRGFEFNVDFDNAGGLKPGADVAIAGYNVGSVKALQFRESGRTGPGESAVAVRAMLTVRPEYSDSIRESSKFYITTRGVLGEPYIEIVTESLDAPAVVDGASLRGVDPPRMDMIVSRGAKLLEVLIDLLENPEVSTKDLIKNTSELIATLNDILKGNRGDIDGAISGVRRSVDQAEKLLTALNVGVEDGQPINELIVDLRASAKDLRRTSTSARRIADEVDGRIKPTLDDVDATLKTAKSAAESADRLISSSEPKLARSLDDLEVAAANARELSEDGKTIVARVERGEGSVGKLLKDREIYDDLKELMRQIKRKPWKIIWKE